MTREQKQYEDDDGRVICSMDVEGMPWHDRRARRDKKAAAEQVHAPPPAEEMTHSEARRFTLNAVLAALLVALVFSLAWVLFTLFCTQVWLR